MIFFFNLKKCDPAECLQTQDCGPRKKNLVLGLKCIYMGSNLRQGINLVVIIILQYLCFYHIKAGAKYFE